jgi:hypothetical protein
MIEKIERTIQYYGLIRPPSDIKNIKWWRLTADIIRPQISEYRNDRYPVPQGFWGYVQSMYAGRVLQTYRISYKNEILAYNIDTDLFLQQNVSCSLEAFLTTAVNFAIALNLPPIQRNNPIKDWRNLSLPIEEFRVRLLTEQTVFKFTYEWEGQANCEVPLSEFPEPPPPPPDSPPTEVPPTTPNSGIPPISDAYDGDEDGGLTYNPDPDGGGGDGQGEACVPYDVTFEVIDGGLSDPVQVTIELLGVIEGIDIAPDSIGSNGEAVFITSGGLDGNGECIQGVRNQVFVGLQPNSTASIVSVTPKP